MSLPDLSPLLAPEMICRQCGSKLKMTVVKQNRGQKKVVAHLEYSCKNPESGCNYKLESTDMTHSTMVQLREDGSEAMR